MKGQVSQPHKQEMRAVLHNCLDGRTEAEGRMVAWPSSMRAIYIARNKTIHRLHCLDN